MGCKGFEWYKWLLEAGMLWPLIYKGDAGHGEVMSILNAH
jgi:hypothetical protein